MEIIALQIISDSTCELTKEDQERLGVIVVPLTVHFDEESYFDGVDLTPEAFYDKLEHSETLPKTSMVPPDRFSEVFAACVDRGDDVVGIFISSEISGTYHAACIAKESFPDGKVSVIDSRSASLSLALLVLEAVKIRDAGATASEMVDQMAALIKKVRFFAAVNTLKYLRMGGRIYGASAVVGEILGIKPIVSIIDGTIHSIGKARGMTNGIKHLLQEALRQMPDLQHEFVVAHSGAPELIEKAIAQIKNPLGLRSFFTCGLGATIGTYAGRGCIGIAYIAR